MTQETVLIIEDDQDIRTTLEEICVQEGYKVFGASNGEEAMEILQKIEGACLILLDVFMPTMAGFDFLKARRETRRFVQIPVVAMSIHKEIKIPFEALRVLQKPIDLNELIAVIKQHCRPSAAA